MYTWTSTLSNRHLSSMSTKLHLFTFYATKTLVFLMENEGSMNLNQVFPARAKPCILSPFYFLITSYLFSFAHFFKNRFNIYAIHNRNFCRGMPRPSWNKSQAIQQVLSLKKLLESGPNNEKISTAINQSNPNWNSEDSASISLLYGLQLASHSIGLFFLTMSFNRA